MDKHSADEAIRAALARGDPAAIELMWRRYANGLFAWLQAVLCSKHDAEDVLGAIFVKMVRNRCKLAKARRLDRYVYRTAQNEARSFIRRRRRQRAGKQAIDSWLVTQESGGRQTELTEQLQTALARLPQAQREVVVLKVYRDKTFREIARLLGLSLNTAASRYRYGIRKLRILLEDPAE